MPGGVDSPVRAFGAVGGTPYFVARAEGQYVWDVEGRRYTVVVPYNVVPEVGGDVACVIVEPVAANMGVVAPAPGFLAGLRAACDAAGALLVLDEVITGFRVARGGAQSLYGVTPDLSTFGK